MFSLPGILALIFLFIVRPQEYFTFLQRFPLLYLLLALAALGFVIDIKLRQTRPSATPQLVWVLLFIVWAIISDAVRAPESVSGSIKELAILFVVFYVMAHSVQTFKAFHLLSAAVFGLIVFLSFVGVHQSFSHFGCIELDPNSTSHGEGKHDGRQCVDAQSCYENDPEPGAMYACERIGLFGTSSVAQGRVRYRGVLQDPNELALTLCAGLPLGFGLFLAFRTKRHLIMAIVGTLLVMITVKFSGSRGGLLVLMLTLGVFVFKRYRWKAIILGGVLALPMLVVLGGQDRSDAKASSVERLECLYEGMNMFRQSPIVGVGYRQFTEHHFLTAHNSYVLAPAELGLPGSFFWFGIMYITVKMLFLAFRYFSRREDGELAASWALSLLATFLGILLGIFFLSFNYHIVLWIFFGIAGAFYSAAKSHAPNWHVRFTIVDLAALTSLTLVVVFGLYVFTRLNPP
jgi:hypothetical protein